MRRTAEYVWLVACMMVSQRESNGLGDMYPKILTDNRTGPARTPCSHIPPPPSAPNGGLLVLAPSHVIDEKSNRMRMTSRHYDSFRVVPSHLE